jgi:site-specific DNA-methyltransferase (adenine-specific)
MRIETIGEATLYLGDCLEILPTLGKVDAVVTSPPYGNIRDYGEKGSAPRDSVEILSRLLIPGGVCVWNCSDQTINGSESGESFRQALAFMGTGIRLHDTMIYCKECVTFPDANRYLPAWEYIFIFSNGSPKHFNGIKDRPNKWAGTPVHGTRRQADGSLTRPSGYGRETPSLGLRWNWWVLNTASQEERVDHPARMPSALASGQIVTWTDPGETILDPFMGSGTTGVACANLGRKFIGIEIEPKYFDIACRRIETAYRQPRLFEDEKPEPVQGDLGLTPSP